ncbi:MAG: class I SAM-dependent methyltransferase [Halobacteria archaeon]
MTGPHLRHGHSADDPRALAHEVGSNFWSLVAREDLKAETVLDVGCGTGSATRRLATVARRVVGLDVDPKALDRAKREAEECRVKNVEFVQGDATAADYAKFGPLAMVTSHYFMEDGVVRRAGAALPRGGTLVFACFHPDRYREAGIESRFGYSEERMRGLLEESGFAVEALLVERERARVASYGEACMVFGERAVRRWKEDGRWEAVARFIDRGGGMVTLATLVGKGRKI